MVSTRSQTSPVKSEREGAATTPDKKKFLIGTAISGGDLMTPDFASSPCGIMPESIVPASAHTECAIPMKGCVSSVLIIKGLMQCIRILETCTHSGTTLWVVACSMAHCPPSTMVTLLASRVISGIGRALICGSDSHERLWDYPMVKS